MALREWERPCEELSSGAGHADILFAGLQCFHFPPYFCPVCCLQILRLPSPQFNRSVPLCTAKYLDDLGDPAFQDLRWK